MAAPHITGAVRLARIVRSHRSAMLSAMAEVRSAELTAVQRMLLEVYLDAAERTVLALDPVSEGHLYRRKLNAE